MLVILLLYQGNIMFICYYKRELANELGPISSLSYLFLFVKPLLGDHFEFQASFVNSNQHTESHFIKQNYYFSLHLSTMQVARGHGAILIQNAPDLQAFFTCFQNFGHLSPILDSKYHTFS